jgi:hypothetical protein
MATPPLVPVTRNTTEELMIAKCKAFWASLPHQAQAAIVAVASGFVAAFVHAASEGNCYTAACWEHYAATGVAAALMVARGFYMLPNRGNEIAKKEN